MGDEKPRGRKPEWLRQFEGRKVYREGRNDGVFVFRQRGQMEGNEFDNICFAKFFDNEDGEIVWRARKTTSKNGKTWYAYDLITFPIGCAEEFATAVLNMSGAHEDVIKELKTEEVDDEVAKMADEMGI